MAALAATAVYAAFLTLLALCTTCSTDAFSFAPVGRIREADWKFMKSKQSARGLVLYMSADDNISRRTLIQSVKLVASGAIMFCPSLHNQVLAWGGSGVRVVYGEEEMMVDKEHGTTAHEVQANLRYDVNPQLADIVCSYSRRHAEKRGYFETTNVANEILNANGQPLTFFDSVTGKPLFVAPVARSASQFLSESSEHGWLSFRDNEVVWDNVRLLKSRGEMISVDGTHLGANYPDRRGNRYSINLVSISGNPNLDVINKQRQDELRDDIFKDDVLRAEVAKEVNRWVKTHGLPF